MILKIQSSIISYLNKKCSSLNLSIFRIGFGFLMFFSLLRFWFKGWIELLYIKPKFHFSYYGFEWVKPLNEYTYLIFLICIISTVLLAIGYKYRISIIVFFLSFTYIELMDKTTYLNHYYFISCLSFLMIFLPANLNLSIDSKIQKKKVLYIPQWSVDCIKLLVSIVFIYAGLAKLNSDWLFSAMPLKIWLTSKYDIPIIGEYILQQNWTHYIMSWGGMLYDLSIPFLLIFSRTRIIGFIFVIIFHLFTAILFPIGMFPYIMIFSCILFFHDNFFKNISNILKKVYMKNKLIEVEKNYKIRNENKIIYIILVFFILQLIIPFRHLLYDGELLWKEEGYRFSWRVMLTEKKGTATFRLVDRTTNTSFLINNDEHLTEFQEKQMSFQSDFILEYAHYLGDYYKNKGIKKPEVYVDAFVTLNGRKSKRYIDNKTNLYEIKRSLKSKEWILNLDEKIYGF